MNRLMIIGNLTRDPEIRSTQSGIRVCTFSVAVNRQGKEKDSTDYFRVTTWRELAENCNRYLAKGSKVAVAGRVTLNEYKAQDGTNRAQMEIDQVDEVEFLTRKDDVTREDELPFRD